MVKKYDNSYETIKEILFKDNDRYYFLTGGAGTGKTYTINRLKEDYNTILLSSTAISALLIGGSTLHSFFNLSICSNTLELEAYHKKHRDKEWYKKKTKNIKKSLSTSKLLIVDEISMVSSSLLECIIYRLIEASSDIKVLFVGDLYQLPPIKDRLVLNHPIFNNITIFNLNTVKRSEDNVLIEMISNLREYKDIDRLNIFCNSISREFVNDAIILTSTNRLSDDYNSGYYKLNSNKEHNFSATITVLNSDNVSDSEIKSFIKQAPINEELTLKEGLRVIITKNSKEYYNGELGYISSIDDDIYITKDNGVNVKIKPEAFGLNKYIDGEFITVAEVVQYPLLMGYAITIHKSQGQGYKYCNIDCSKMFLSQQLYVALSRATDSKYISMKNYNSNIIRKNSEVDRYFSDRDVINLD